MHWLVANFRVLLWWHTVLCACGRGVVGTREAARETTRRAHTVAQYGWRKHCSLARVHVRHTHYRTNTARRG